MLLHQQEPLRQARQQLDHAAEGDRADAVPQLPHPDGATTVPADHLREMKQAWLLTLIPVIVRSAAALPGGDLQLRLRAARPREGGLSAW